MISCRACVAASDRDLFTRKVKLDSRLTGTRLQCLPSLVITEISWFLYLWRFSSPELSCSRYRTRNQPPQQQQQSQQQSFGSTAGRISFSMAQIEAFQRHFSDAHQAATPVRGCIMKTSPAADKQVTAACISTIGSAFSRDAYIQRVFGVKPGNEPRLLEGMSRVYLDRFRDAQLLYHLQDCRSAAIVYTSEQSYALDNEVSFSIVCSILPGLMHMLRVLPLLSLPKLLSLVDRMNSEGAAAVKAAGVVGSYLKLIVIATQPQHQHQGLGTAVLQAVTADADKQQLPLYLEAIEDCLVPWYQRHGFICIGEVDVQPDNHSRVVQLMLRMPQQLSE
jgi:ribosomal protein S18 acetylase RimI-like enzyme